MEKPKNLPKTPGVYKFLDETGKIIYIGKAKNLSSRIDSYFSNNLLPKTKQMVATASSLEFIQTSSEIEALLLEAFLVRKFMPKFNIELKDDKSPLYIGITKDIYPRIIALRKTQLKLYKLKEVLGPFVDSGSVKRILRMARRIFPYATHVAGRRPCLYSQIGLCKPCPSAIEQAESEMLKADMRKAYLKNISSLRKLLNGKINPLKKELETQMQLEAKQQNFEAAGAVKNQLQALENLTYTPSLPENYLKDPNLLEDIRNQELETLGKIIKNYYPQIGKIRRIECFDVAHLAGTFPTASMVTFIDGEPDKRFYRHFKIKKAYSLSDVDMMREILTRRIKNDWGVPDLVIIDGGKPQVSVAMEVFGDSVPVVGLAKRYETFVVKQGEKFSETKIPIGPALNLVQRIRNEAHRFARRYHHSLVSKAITG